MSISCRNSHLGSVQDCIFLTSMPNFVRIPAIALRKYNAITPDLAVGDEIPEYIHVGQKGKGKNDGMESICFYCFPLCLFPALPLEDD